MLDEPHDHRDVFRQRYGLHRQLVAVDEQRVPRHACGNAQLVHDSGRHATGTVLGAPAELRQRDGIAVEPERQSRSEFERCAARQSCADGDVRGDPGVHGMRSGAHLGRNTGHVTSPRWLHRCGVLDR